MNNLRFLLKPCHKYFKRFLSRMNKKYEQSEAMKSNNRQTNIADDTKTSQQRIVYLFIVMSYLKIKFCVKGFDVMTVYD